MQPIQEMYNYHAWANGVIINRLKELPTEVYFQECQSGFSTISKVIAHIYTVDLIWYDILTGKSMKDAFSFANQEREYLEAIGIDEMETNFAELTEKYTSLLCEEDPDRVIVVDNPYAGLLETSVAESVLHVVTHGSYHRGNIATMLRQLGHTSVMQDYGLYLYDKQN